VLQSPDAADPSVPAVPFIIGFVTKLSGSEPYCGNTSTFGMFGHEKSPSGTS
jgi:hypothetical protein